MIDVFFDVVVLFGRVFINKAKTKPAFLVAEVFACENHGDEIALVVSGEWRAPRAAAEVRNDLEGGPDSVGAQTAATVRIDATDNSRVASGAIGARPAAVVVGSAAAVDAVLAAADGRAAPDAVHDARRFGDVLVSAPARAAVVAADFARRHRDAARKRAEREVLGGVGGELHFSVETLEVAFFELERFLLVVLVVAVVVDDWM